ncbi:hypothetical protein [Roseimicrobium sp. ORNL1]|uniref:hypothetical protein n=1 Tax=Roseimicrobium sp. ORNL1 TaxID=2711231 RepID=UPI0013E1E674|nr:hypothetical protein [Roseimicrobium sp. ORNL1]QIF02081.1 hypothetical protein G5S37_11235 [Roseimicrobium sp. ORNL1]
MKTTTHVHVLAFRPAPASVAPVVLAMIACLWLGMSLLSPCVAADPANRFWYTVTISRVNTTTTFTGSSDLGPDQFAVRVAGETPVLLENLRVEALVPGDDGVKWHAVTENPNVYLMPRAVLFFQELRMDPLIERRQTPTTFRSVR